LLFEKPGLRRRSGACVKHREATEEKDSQHPDQLGIEGYFQEANCFAF